MSNAGICACRKLDDTIKDRKVVYEICFKGRNIVIRPRLAQLIKTESAKSVYAKH